MNTQKPNPGIRKPGAANDFSTEEAARLAQRAARRAQDALSAEEQAEQAAARGAGLHPYEQDLSAHSDMPYEGGAYGSEDFDNINPYTTDSHETSYSEQGQDSNLFEGFQARQNDSGSHLDDDEGSEARFSWLGLYNNPRLRLIGLISLIVVLLILAIVLISFLIREQTRVKLLRQTLPNMTHTQTAIQSSTGQTTIRSASVSAPIATTRPVLVTLPTQFAVATTVPIAESSGASSESSPSSGAQKTELGQITGTVVSEATAKSTIVFYPGEIITEHKPIQTTLAQASSNTGKKALNLDGGEIQLPASLPKEIAAESLQSKPRPIFASPKQLVWILKDKAGQTEFFTSKVQDLQKTEQSPDGRYLLVHTKDQLTVFDAEKRTETALGSLDMIADSITNDGFYVRSGSGLAYFPFKQPQLRIVTLSLSEYKLSSKGAYMLNIVENDLSLIRSVDGDIQDRKVLEGVEPWKALFVADDGQSYLIRNNKDMLWVRIERDKKVETKIALTGDLISIQILSADKQNGILLMAADGSLIRLNNDGKYDLPAKAERAKSSEFISLATDPQRTITAFALNQDGVISIWNEKGEKVVQYKDSPAQSMRRAGNLLLHLTANKELRLTDISKLNTDKLADKPERIATDVTKYMPTSDGSEIFYISKGRLMRLQKNNTIVEICEADDFAITADGQTCIVRQNNGRLLEVGRDNKALLINRESTPADPGSLKLNLTASGYQTEYLNSKEFVWFYKDQFQTITMP